MHGLRDFRGFLYAKVWVVKWRWFLQRCLSYENVIVGLVMIDLNYESD